MHWHTLKWNGARFDGLLFKFHEDWMSGFEVIANNISANRAGVICQIKYARVDPEKKRKQYFMVTSLLFQFRED